MLQFLWLFFHVTRLLLIVEPCHLASVEVSMRRMRACVRDGVPPICQASAVLCPDALGHTADAPHKTPSVEAGQRDKCRTV